MDRGTVTEPQTAAGRTLARHLGLDGDEDILAIEQESQTLVLDALEAAVRQRIAEAGGECRVEGDAVPICLTHNEIAVDGACEDQPVDLLVVLDLIAAQRRQP